MAFKPNETIGSFTILEQIGQGGMATVYKAYHNRLDRYVALKVLHKVYQEDDNFSARFEREGRMVARLEHPNIVPVYDFAEYEGNPFLVMKLIEGETLKTLLKKSELPIDAIVAIVESVGDALHYAHQQNVLHRDVKPSNIMFDKSGMIYLTDFGLARMVISDEPTLSQDMLLGTPQYISPEQARGDESIDHRADLYSFGVVIYEMLVGKVPFSADTPYAIVHDHIYTPLPRPTQLNPDVPLMLEGFLMKALSKGVNDRYYNAEEMVSAFKELVEFSENDPLELISQVDVENDPSTTAELSAKIPPPPPPIVEEVVPEPEPQPVVEPEPEPKPVRSPEPTTVPQPVPIQKVEIPEADPKQQKKKGPRRSSVWATIALVALILSLVGGGLVLGQVIREEYNAVFNGTESILPIVKTVIL